MPQINQKRQKTQIKTPPAATAPYTPPAIRGPLPANWYVAQMVVLDPPEPVRKDKKKK